MVRINKRDFEGKVYSSNRDTVSAGMGPVTVECPLCGGDGDCLELTNLKGQLTGHAQPPQAEPKVQKCIEFRNQGRNTLFAGAVRVEATGKVFLYISDESVDGSKNPVEPGDFAVVDIESAEF